LFEENLEITILSETAAKTVMAMKPNIFIMCYSAYHCLWTQWLRCNTFLGRRDI